MMMQKLSLCLSYNKLKILYHFFTVKNMKYEAINNAAEETSMKTTASNWTH